jgi:hypothetical protein
MYEDSHTQIGLKVSVVLIFQDVTAQSLGCSNYRYHRVTPITINARAGDQIIVSAGKTMTSAIVKRIFVPAPLLTFIPRPNPTPTSLVSIGYTGVDLASVEKTAVALDKSLNNASYTKNVTVFCASITDGYFAWLNQNRPPPNCLIYVSNS